MAKPIQSYPEMEKVEWFTSKDNYVIARVVERLNRAIKGMMWEYFHYTKSNKWLKSCPS